MILSTANMKLLFEGKNVLVYLNPSNRDYPTPTIVKIFKKSHPTPEELNKFYNEYTIAQVTNEHGNSLNNAEGVRKVLQKDTIDQRPAIHLEY